MSAASQDRNGSTWVGGGLSLVLFALAFAKGRGMLDSSVELGLSAVVFLSGAAWAAMGRATLARASELYLWLAFIVSVNHLQVFAQATARWTGSNELDVFRVTAIIHVLIVIGALWVLGAWSDRAGDTSGHARVAAGLFVLGAVVFWVGARTFPGTALDQVLAHEAGHVWTSINFLIATLITLAGLVLLTLALRGAGDRWRSLLGLAAFSFGAVFWTLHLIYRLTVLMQAAQEWGETAAAPPWFEPWRLWAAWLFALYSILAYIGLAGYGGALLRIGWVARWAGWSCVVAGPIAAPLGGLPLFIHVPLWVVGILLLRENRSWPLAELPVARAPSFR